MDLLDYNGFYKVHDNADVFTYAIDTARTNKDYERADALREMLRSRGFEVRTKNGITRYRTPYEVWKHEDEIWFWNYIRENYIEGDALSRKNEKIGGFPFDAEKSRRRLDEIDKSIKKEDEAWNSW